MKIEFDSESELENYLLQYYKDNQTCLVTGESYDMYISQFNLDCYGIADLVGITVGAKGEIYCDVIELKKKTICMKAIAQVSRYKTALQELLSDYSELVAVHGYVVGTDVALDDSAFLLNHAHVLYGIISFNPDEGIMCDIDRGQWKYKKPEFVKAKEKISKKLSPPKLKVVEGGK